MEKKTKDSESKISLKVILKEVIVGTIVGVLVTLISRNFFTIEKDNGVILLLFFVIGLVVYLFVTLIRRLIKEVEAKKDLESKNKSIKQALELTKIHLSSAESRTSSAKKDADMYRNFFKDSQKKIEELHNQKLEQWSESEDEILNLRFQLKDNKVPWFKHHISDKRLRKELIDEIKGYWEHVKADRRTGKIKDKTIDQFLPSHWRENFENKEGDDIIEEWKRLIKLIDDFAK